MHPLTQGEQGRSRRGRGTQEGVGSVGVTGIGPLLDGRGVYVRRLVDGVTPFRDKGPKTSHPYSRPSVLFLLPGTLTESREPRPVST